MSNNNAITQDVAQTDNFFSLLTDKDRHAIWNRLEKADAKAQAKVVRPSPLTAFDLDFQRIVGPKLEGYVRLGGYLLSRGLDTYAEAHTRIMRAAMRRGALHLSPDAFLALDAWIGSALLAALEENAQASETIS